MEGNRERSRISLTLFLTLQLLQLFLQLLPFVRDRREQAFRLLDARVGGVGHALSAGQFALKLRLLFVETVHLRLGLVALFLCGSDLFIQRLLLLAPVAVLLLELVVLGVVPFHLLVERVDLLVVLAGLYGDGLFVQIGFVLLQFIAFIIQFLLSIRQILCLLEKSTRLAIVGRHLRLGITQLAVDRFDLRFQQTSLIFLLLRLGFLALKFAL